MMSSSIVCSQSSKPLLGLTQDSLLGAHLMSNHPLEEVDFGSILYQAGVEVAYEDFIIPVLLKPKRLYVGFQLINCVLRDLEIDLGEHYNHAGVLIRNGEIIEATFTKATLGIADNSLIHRVFLMYGHNKACLFLERVQRVAEHFMDYHGFSVGISDCVVEHTPLNIDGVDRVIREDLEMRGRMPDEDKLCAALNSITQIAAPESCIGNNRILDMIHAGSKGSMVNFNQITRMLSQQFSAQGRLLPEMSNETRYLPHLTKFDYSLEARGFIKNSFIKGLTPIEFWLHAKPSRINLIDTSCKTSVTGDQQRRLVKTLERIVVNDAGSGSRIVQNMTNGQVVSFQYGEDGLGGTYMRTFDEL